MYRQSRVNGKFMLALSAYRKLRLLLTIWELLRNNISRFRCNYKNHELSSVAIQNELAKELGFNTSKLHLCSTAALCTENEGGRGNGYAALLIWTKQAYRRGTFSKHISDLFMRCRNDRMRITWIKSRSYFPSPLLL
jgi:hypothetical protein